MPTKSNKKKKSKAALEAELKAKEEEEERLRLEEEQENERLRLLKKEEDEKQERKKLQEVQFQKDENEMEEIKTKRHTIFCQEMKLLQDEQEWKEYLLCNDRSLAKNHDIVNLNCFLYEHRIEHGDIITAKDLCNFCDDVATFTTELSADALYTNVQETSDDTIENTLTNDFVSKCLVLLGSKVDIVTSQFLKQRHKIPSHEGVLSVEGKTSSFDLRLYGVGNQSENSSTKVIMKNSMIELPPSYFSKNGVIVRVMKIPFHKNQGLHSGSPLIVGDTYQISVIHLPTPANQVGQWSVKSDNSCDVKTSHINDKIRCHIDIPNFIIESDSFTLLRQDDDSKGWSDKGIYDVTFDFVKRRVYFVLSEVESTVAIAFSKDIDLKYKSWSIGPAKSTIHDYSIPNQNRVEFLVETPRFFVRIQVIGINCYLIKPQLSQLSDILHKPHTPERLLLMLSQRGIHLLPYESQFSALHDSSMKKNRLIEERFYKDMSLLCFSFDVKSSPHNAILDSSRAIYNVRESDTFTGNSNMLPMYQIMMTFDKNDNFIRSDEKKNANICNANERVFCSLTDANDLSVTNDAHLYSIFTLKTHCSPEAYNRVEMSSPCSGETMKRLLWLVNPINFTNTKSE